MVVPAAPAAHVFPVGDHLEVSWEPAAADLGQNEEGEDYVSNVTSWEVERSADGSTGWAQVKDESDEGTLYYGDTAANTATTEYFYRVRGVNGDGNGAYSGVTSETTISAPTAPTDITAAVSALDIRVAWVLPAQDHTSLVLSQKKDAAAYAVIATLTPGQTQYLDTTVVAGSDYLYQIKAVNAAGDSSTVTLGAAVTALAAVPTAPSALAWAAQTVGAGLAWTANEAVNVDTQEVQRSDDNGMTWASLTTTLGSAIDTYDDTTAVQDTHYWYRVRALWSTHDSAWSGTVFAIGGGAQALDGYRPNNPRRFTAVALSSASIQLFWMDCSITETGYSVQHKLTTASTWENRVVVSSGTTTHTYSSLLIATTYDFRLQALGSSGTASGWVTVQGTTSSNGGGSVPTAPSGLALSQWPPRSLSILAEWTDNSSNETGFEVEWWRLDNPAKTLLEQLAAGTTSTQIDFDPVTGFSPLTANQTYYVRVRAYNAAGNSAWTPGQTIFINAISPIAYAPSDLHSTEITENSVAMAWTDMNMEGTTDRFQLERSYIGETGPWEIIAQVAGGITAFVDSGLSDDTLIWYRVKSFIVGYGLSPASNVLMVRTSAGYPGELDPPTNLTASTPTTGTVRLHWTYDYQQTRHLGFKVYRDTVLIATLSDPSQREYDDETVANGTAYVYYVTAFNSNRESESSGDVNITSSSPVGVVPDDPTNLIGYLASNHVAVLTWEDNSNNETGFKIRRSAVTGGPYTTIATTAQDITAYTDVTLAASTDYFYIVTATNGFGDSTNDTNEVELNTGSGEPAAPTGPAASIVATGPNSVDISWSSDDGLEESWDVNLGTSIGGLASIATPSRGTQSYTKTGLFANTRYYARVDAVNATGTGEGSVVFATTENDQGPGSGPKGKLVPFVRGFDKDSPDVTLYTAPNETWITYAYIFTPDASNGPFAVLKVGGAEALAIDSTSGNAMTHSVRVAANQAVTVGFSGSGNGIGGYAITVLVV